MPTVELLKLIALLLGVSIVSVVGGIMLVLMYPGLKLIISDVATFLGFLGKWVRKTSLATEVEGTVNSFARRYNAELIMPFLPECDVQWVTENNHDTVITPGKVIVKLGFSDDRDLNVFNAATLFVRAGLLARTKPFLTRVISSAIDLLVVRNLLKLSQRTALTVFNDRFKDEALDCRELFYRLEEIDAGGLFKRVLLQEYYFFGETVGDRVPKPEYADEAQRFLDWLYSLVMREYDEKSILQFTGENIRVGVLLIARDDTYKKYGLTPYLRRANTYASDDFSTIYLISRGRRRGDVTKQIASELVSLGCFEQLTKRPDIHTAAEGEEGVITCIPMRIDLVGLVQAAWENLSTAYRDNQEITVVVKEVTPERVSVDSFGLRVELSPPEFSSLLIPDARRYFSVGQELLVRITEFDQENQWVRVSNVGTATDPKRLIDDFSANVEETVSAVVTGYSASDGYETGMFIQPEGFEVKGYVPRSRATYSRFVQLSERYPVGGTVEVRPVTFDVDHATYSCELAGISDPWLRISDYRVDSLCVVTVRQIRERHLTCELEEGLEGTVYFEEVSWDTPEANLITIKNFRVNDTLQTKILGIDEERRFIRLSIKRTEDSASEKFFVENKNAVLAGRVVEIRPNGAMVQFDDEIRGFLPISEVSHTFCDGLADLFDEDDTVSVKIIDYNPYFDNLLVSIKATKPNDYEAFRLAHAEGSEVNARIDICKKQQIDVVIEFGESMSVSGYIHRSEVSNLLFVSEENIEEFFKRDLTYPFVVKRFHDKLGVVELSRKQLFQNEYLELEYGVPYMARIIPRTRGESVAYSERFEGRIVGRSGNVTGREAEVIVARRGGRASDVEVELVRP